VQSRRATQGCLKRGPPSDHEGEGEEGTSLGSRAGQCAGEVAAVLPIDPVPDGSALIRSNGGETAGEHLGLTQIQLEFLEASTARHLQGQPDDLDVGIEAALPKQLGTSLERFPRPVAAFRLLAKYPARVAETQRI